MHIVSKDCFDFTIKYLTVLILLFCLSPSYSAEHIRYQLETASSEPVGDSAYFLKEPDQLLSFQQIQQAEFQEQFIQSNLQVLTLGVGSKPAWVKLPIKNNSTERVKRKLVVDAPWLDDVQVYIQHLETNQVEYYQTGDNHPFSSRPLETRTFHFDASIQPGDTDIYIRVATPDPMVIPIYLLKDTDADAMTLTFQYGYGFGYGFLIALLAYNFMLFIGLREFRYLLYVIYLGTFTAMNFTYTGHGFMWLWRENMLWQQWSHPLLIAFFGMTGLTFALYFLDTKSYAPRLHHAVNLIIGIATVVVLTTVFLNAQTAAFLASFIFLTSYLILMLVLGVFGLEYGQPSARYFLLAMIAGLIGVATSMFSAWGFLPFNSLTFNAAQIGTLVEAVLLAFALSHRFRYVEEQKLKAEKMALIDPLTEINNRRSFYQKANNLWSIAERHNRLLSVIMFDIDDFKLINDQHGHKAGDKALKETGKMISRLIRKGDIAARWGGEEFILLLAESDIDDATAFAERIRESLSVLRVQIDGQRIGFTASFGVAEKRADELSIDALIERADHALYQAKTNGKDQVAAYSSELVCPV